MYSRREVAKYRKRPTVIEALQYTKETEDKMTTWLLDHGCSFGITRRGALVITTWEGDMRAMLGDWIIKGIKGEFYPCKSDIFEATYEVALE